MGFASKYLEKHQFLSIDVPRVSSKTGLLKYIVIIPAYSEPDIFVTLQSVKEAEMPIASVEVYILINYSENVTPNIVSEESHRYTNLQEWSQTNSSNKISFHPFIARALPRKHAGAGLARKILMDAACERFSNLNIDDGVIISLDADSVVPKNYFTSLEKFNQEKSADCYIFNFAHPIKGDEFSEEIYRAITLYELHLRYYRNILESIGFPFAHYTIGSCFAVAARAYIKVGGMSRRQAGEDFYFLHKVFPNFTTCFLSNVKVIPSPRPSERVPFGTGPVINKIITEGSFETYNPRSFFDLSPFLELIPQLWYLQDEKLRDSVIKLPKSINQYLTEVSFPGRLDEIKKNCASRESFIKRFYNWFDAFNVLKYLNFCRDNFYRDVDIIDAVNLFLSVEEQNAGILLGILQKRDEIPV